MICPPPPPPPYILSVLIFAFSLNQICQGRKNIISFLFETFGDFQATKYKLLSEYQNRPRLPDSSGQFFKALSYKDADIIKVNGKFPNFSNQFNF